MILEHVPERLRAYPKSRKGRIYEAAARSVYRAREAMGPFSEAFVPHIVSGLEAFDMSRVMYNSAEGIDKRAVEEKLRTGLTLLHRLLSGLEDTTIGEVDVAEWEDRVQAAYMILADPDVLGMHRDGSSWFHVGATKTLHWLCPALFVIVDSNTAAMFREEHGIPFRNTTQPGYCADKYVRCLDAASQEVLDYGPERLQAHEPGTPLARIFDKVAWVAGGGI